MDSLELVRNIQTFPWNGLWLIPGAPLMGALVNGILTLWAARSGREVSKSLQAGLAVAASFTAFATSYLAWGALRACPEGGQLAQDVSTWIEAGNLHARIGFQLDPLSAVMILFITFVALLIHVYSIGYMHKDPGFGRFFTYLNLFLAAMLILVLADNLLLLFVGWEGVGLCSFLLISFWFEDAAKAEAGKKAFLTNRIGDAGFLLATFVVLGVTGTLNFNEIQAQHQLFTPGLATAACLLFFMGAAGKSAQIPLYVWLPDAMAGPTPVSALIHAATMVTAGVYLVARLHFLYALSPVALAVVACVGAATALFAATIALAQNDIKKVLAYSTVSQLGYMFVGVGVGAYEAGIFHVMTHAFFKACLFLGAGSVIHAMHEEQDIRKMGGLMKHLPITGITFFAAYLAIIGFPGFAGFFSKDEILWKALATPNPTFPWLPLALYGILLVGALLTAFYMTRLVVLTFFGEFRGGPKALEKLHESPKIMTIPLVLLALGALMAGWLGVPESIGPGRHVLGAFLEPVFHGSAPDADGIPERFEILFMLLSVAVAFAGMGLAWAVYGQKKTFVMDETEKRFPGLREILQNKFYVDELYDHTVLAAVRLTAKYVSFKFIDQMVIEKSVEICVSGVQALGRGVKRLQTGSVRWTVAGLAAGAAFLLFWVVR